MPDRKHDWPAKHRRDGRTDGSGPDMPDWPTEDDRRRRPHKMRA